MITTLYNYSFFHYHNLVGIFDCAQPMSYHNDRPSFKKLLQVFKDDCLIVGFKRISCFIKEQQRRIFVNGPGYEYSLFLSLAYTITFRPYFCMVSQRQGFDEVMNIRNPGRLVKLLLINHFIAHGYVASNSIRKDKPFLHYHTTLLPPGGM